jgi:hypothetical protein
MDLSSRAGSTGLVVPGDRDWIKRIDFLVDRPN